MARSTHSSHSRFWRQNAAREENSSSHLTLELFIGAEAHSKSCACARIKFLVESSICLIVPQITRLFVFSHSKKKKKKSFFPKLMFTCFKLVKLAALRILTSFFLLTANSGNFVRKFLLLPDGNLFLLVVFRSSFKIHPFSNRIWTA